MKKPKNQGKAWDKATEQELKKLAKQNTPTRVMGLKLGRTPASIYSKASDMKLQLKPVNQSPYGTKKKKK